MGGNLLIMRKSTLPEKYKKNYNVKLRGYVLEDSESIRKELGDLGFTEKLVITDTESSEDSESEKQVESIKLNFSSGQKLELPKDI